MLNGTRRFGALAIAVAIVCGGMLIGRRLAHPGAHGYPGACNARAQPLTAGTPRPGHSTPAPVTYTYRCTKGDGQLNGAGATFPYPLYSKWGADYNTKCGVKLNYQSIGSGGGVKGWQQNTVDFGASDAFLADSEIAAAAKNGEPVEIPVTFGAVVVAYNLKGLSAPLKMTADIIAGIFDGKITEVERSGDRGRESRRHPPDHGYQRRPSLGRLGHHEHLHDLPDADEPGLGDHHRQGRQDQVGRQDRHVARRPGRQRQRGRHPGHQPDGRRRRLHRASVRPVQPHPVRRCAEQLRCLDHAIARLRDRGRQPSELPCGPALQPGQQPSRRRATRSLARPG